MRNLALLPEALVVASAVALVVIGRFGWGGRVRQYLPHATALLVLAALAAELWAGTTPNTYFGGALIQDRFALFVKLAALLASLVAVASTDWTSEDSLHLGLAMPLLAAFGAMVAASAGDVLGLWAGLELAGAAGVVLVGLRRPDLGLRLLVVGGAASALILVGLVFLYANVGDADLAALRAALMGRQGTIVLAIPVLLLLSGLAVRAGVAPFHVGTLPAGLGASPLGAGLLIGLVAVAVAIVALKLGAALLPVPELYAPYVQVVAAIGMVGGGAAALAVRSPRPRLAYLAVGQVGWIAAGLSTHFQAGIAGSIFLLGAFAVAATCGPAVLGRAEGGEPAIHGFGAVRPARAAGLALAMLSLAGAPPLAGFFGQLAVAAALAQTGNYALIGLGALGSVLGVAATLGTLRAMFIQSPLEESRRGAAAALPALTAFSTVGAVALSVVVAAYGLFSFPIFGLATQGAEALGLR